jgi:hypothetical protein
MGALKKISQTGDRERPAIALGNVPPWLFPKPSVDVNMIEGRRECVVDVRWCVERWICF